MAKTLYFLVFLILLSIDGSGAITSAISAEAADSASVSKSITPPSNFCSGWALRAEKLHLVKDGLFNYIDGAAELFMEFGFNDLYVYEYGNGDDILTLEIYSMESSKSALGLYLMKCGKDLQLQGKESDEESLRYQIPIMKGSWFILINNSHGEKRLLPAMKALAGEVKKSLPDEKVLHVFETLPGESLVKNSELLFRGPCALQQIFIFGRGDVLKLQGKIFGCAGDYRGEDGSLYTRLIIPYNDKSAAVDACENLVSSLDSEITILSRSDRGFTFSDFEKKYGVVRLDGNKLDITVHLAKAPTL